MKVNLSIVALLALVSSTNSFALSESISLSGQARVRGEIKTDSDYQSKIADRKSFTASRFRLNFKANPNGSKASAFFQPQFTKIWGQNEVTPVDGGATTTSQSSGALNNTGLDVHQAYLDYSIVDSLVLRAGRQEFNLGDQLVVGGVGWHNTARSFDAGALTYTLNENHKIMALRGKLVDENISSADLGDFNLYGLYYMGSFGKFAKNLDLYILDKADHRTASDTDIYVFGLRAKSKINAFDYRFETNFQNGRKIGGKRKHGEYQYDLEVGFTLEKIKARFALEYFDSSKDYDQIMPTAHKWLGYADQFSRRNIKGYVLHAKTGIFDKITFLFDYHVFERHDTDFGAYNFGGASLGTTGKSKKIANEMDFIFKYSVDKNMKIAAGYSIVSPGKYLKDQNVNQKDKTNWSFVQLLANF